MKSSLLMMEVLTTLTKHYDVFKRRSATLTIIRFKKNFGQTPAFSAGFSYATGDYIISMDGDLQNDPQDIPELLRAIEEKI